MEKSEVQASVKFWRGAGVVGSKRKEKTEESSSSETKTTAHKNGVVARFVGVEEYTNDELAEILEESSVTAFVDEAQKALGKIFNRNEVCKLIGLTHQLGFEQEAILAILSYCTRLGKTSLSYAERVAISFYDEDICTAVAVHAHIDYLERRGEAVEKVRSLFGFGGRALSTTEKKLFVTWTDEWGFSVDVISKAYEITVDTIHEPAPKYTNSILKKWHDNGLSTLSDVERYIAEEADRETARPVSRTKAEKSSKSAKHEEIEDWFEQRLKQTFGE
jgi:DnaD/phage-associated family protein